MGNDTRLSLSDIQGPIVDLLAKLEGEAGTVWLLGLKKFLRKENPWEKPEAFMEIEVGTYQSREALCNALLEEDSISVTARAYSIIDKMSFSSDKKILELVVMSVEELGFPDGATYGQICESAENFGLEPCPAEVGPYLSLQYHNQPVGEHLYITMVPIADFKGCPAAFHVEGEKSGHLLCAITRTLSYILPADRKYVFVRRR